MTIRGVWSDGDASKLPRAADTTPLLKLLKKNLVVGSTVDPVNGDRRPYGLTYVATDPPAGSVLRKGDLVVCNYNDGAGDWGKGTTIEYLSSAPGSHPQRLAQGTELRGCGPMSLDALDDVYAPHAFTANNVGILDASGRLRKLLRNPFVAAWSVAYISSPDGSSSRDAIFVSNLLRSEVMRVNVGMKHAKQRTTNPIGVFPENLPPAWESSRARRDSLTMQTATFFMW